ncbi:MULTISPECIES: hypothetical protein [Amycolatopsis]|uniref:Uncharacterized protein n=1 Tax=Amycolatopsis bullii TaxID=941987 RepID=A0ABQ3KIT4_9PSEU|nr:hypothetical protein [Amycolatopsis bullii]GHG29937.1 hypothetical protein GCM10017567_57170 [Amycolatopsis bullii]
MDQQTAELVRTLAGVLKHVPEISCELLTGTMPPERERAFAALLMELADVLTTHANNADARGAPVTLAEHVGLGGRHLVAVAVRLRTTTATPDQFHDTADSLLEVTRMLQTHANTLGLRTPTNASGQPEPPDQ